MHGDGVEMETTVQKSAMNGAGMGNKTVGWGGDGTCGTERGGDRTCGVGRPGG